MSMEGEKDHVSSTASIIIRGFHITTACTPHYDLTTYTYIVAYVECPLSTPVARYVRFPSKLLKPC